MSDEDNFTISSEPTEVAGVSPESKNSQDSGNIKNGEGASLEPNKRIKGKEMSGNNETLKNIESQNVTALHDLSILLEQATANGQNLEEVLDQIIGVGFSKN